MTPPKIKGIFSKEYPGGRSDLFLLDSDRDIHEELISFFRELGISETNLIEFDSVTTDVEGYFFVYEKEIKIHLIISERGINLLIESKIPKEELLDIMERYFQIF